MSDTAEKRTKYLMQISARLMEKYPLEQYEENFEQMKEEVDEILERCHSNEMVLNWLVNLLKYYDKQNTILQGLKEEE